MYGIQEMLRVLLWLWYMPFLSESELAIGDSLRKKRHQYADRTLLGTRVDRRDPRGKGPPG